MSIMSCQPREVYGNEEKPGFYFGVSLNMLTPQFIKMNIYYNRPPKFSL